jgi:hypothetical protein
MDCTIDNVTSEARAFRLAMGEWARGYAKARRLETSPANLGLEAARADLRGWSRRYFARTAEACPGRLE